MPNICIIPARGGSKRIPQKNIKAFHGKPLIAYSIELALKSRLFTKVIVSTDDEKIADIAKAYGAEVPFTRPQELADDFCTTYDVIAHALSWLQQEGYHYDYSCTLYATAPLLQEKYLVEGFEKLKNSDAKMAFAATSMPFPIQRTFKITDKGRCEMFFPQYYHTRSQDLPQAYQDAGEFYWEDLHVERDAIAFSANAIPIVIPRYLVQDIDTLEDFKRAEMMYEIYSRNLS